MEDFVIVDETMGGYVEPGMFIVVEGEHLEVLDVIDGDVLVVDAFSHTTGHREEFPIDYDAYYDVWVRN